MLSKINFNHALIISLSWHLLCFFMVTIIIVPAGARQRRLSHISFLGSILDDGSFRREFKVFHHRSSVRNQGADRFFSSASESQDNERIEIYSDRDYFLKEKPYKLSIGEILEVEKKLPGEGEEKLDLASTVKPPEIESQARDRTVLFKPSLPDIKGIVSTSKRDIVWGYYRVKLKVLIAPDGNVKMVENLQTSGYPEVDLVAIRYAKKWRFAPLSPDKPQDDQEGVLLLEFRTTDYTESALKNSLTETEN